MRPAYDTLHASYSRERDASPWIDSGALATYLWQPNFEKHIIICGPQLDRFHFNIWLAFPKHSLVKVVLIEVKTRNIH